MPQPWLSASARASVGAVDCATSGAPRVLPPPRPSSKSLVASYPASAPLLTDWRERSGSRSSHRRHPARAPRQAHAQREPDRTSRSAGTRATHRRGPALPRQPRAATPRHRRPHRYRQRTATCSASLTPIDFNEVNPPPPHRLLKKVSPRRLSVLAGEFRGLVATGTVRRTLGGVPGWHLQDAWTAPRRRLCRRTRSCA